MASRHGQFKAAGEGPDAAGFAALVRAVADRADRTAFARLFEAFAPRVKAYLLRLGLSNGEAEETAQEVMVTVWRKAGQFDPRQATVATWIYRIARNRRIDAFRRAQRAVLDPDDPMLLPEAEVAADAAMDAAEREGHVREALDALPTEQRDLVRMAFYEDRTHAEIAERTGLPLGTVKSRLRLAFAKLRPRLAGEVE